MIVVGAPRVTDAKLAELTVLMGGRSETVRTQETADAGKNTGTIFFAPHKFADSDLPRRNRAKKYRKKDGKWVEARRQLP
jgi:hypothetical protein